MSADVSTPAPRPAIDHEALARDLADLRAEIEAELGPEDLDHLRKIERWGRLCTAAGYGTAWIAPNLISAALIALGNTTRWAMIMHHVGHGGYDRVPGVPERYTSEAFAAGSRRYLDWLDWMLPEAWRHEHNVLHHYRTGEIEDPDLVEHNMDSLRRSSLPMPVKYAVIAFFVLSWKLSYYAPSTYQVLRAAERRRAAGRGAPAPVQEGNASTFNPLTEEGRAFWKACLLPYAAARFALVPALFSPLGPWAVTSVLANSALAELLANAHTFVIIAPNHAGDDVYRFEGRAADRADFYVRQILGSVNYRTGGDLNDFLHGWLNYQIEHHLWPDLPMRKYQQIQPRVKAICEKHGVPYTQEGVLRRVRKLVDVMVGKASMRVMPARPEVRAAAPRAPHARAAAPSAARAPEPEVG